MKLQVLPLVVSTVNCLSCSGWLHTFFTEIIGQIFRYKYAFQLKWCFKNKVSSLACAGTFTLNHSCNLVWSQGAYAQFPFITNDVYLQSSFLQSQRWFDPLLLCSQTMKMSTKWAKQRWPCYHWFKIDLLNTLKGFRCPIQIQESQLKVTEIEHTQS